MLGVSTSNFGERAQQLSLLDTHDSAEDPIKSAAAIDEIRERHAARGVDGIADMPGEWWIELGAIGTFDVAVRHAEVVEGAKILWVRGDSCLHLDHRILVRASGQVDGTQYI